MKARPVGVRLTGGRNRGVVQLRPAFTLQSTQPEERRIMREKVYNQTIDLLKARGYKQLHMDELARLAGISKKTLYEAFGTKHSLVLYALQREFESTYRELEVISKLADMSAEDKLKASLWLITRRAFECGEQLIIDLRINPVITEAFWQHVEQLNARLLGYYLQTKGRLNEMMLANFFGILINISSGNQQEINRVRLMQETIQFYTHAWAHMNNGLVKEYEPREGS